MKDWLYDHVVRKNDRVCREYERYVQGHMEEHKKKRWKHWLVLLGLAWKYRDSQKDRVHSFVLMRKKDDTAKVRMEWVPGAVCYNIYMSEDGARYRFLTKAKRHVYKIENLPKDRLCFYKFKVSLDGIRYSDFSEILTISTLEHKDKDLYLMEQLTKRQEMGASLGTPGSGRAGGAGTGRNDEGFAGRLLEDGRILLSWKRMDKALHYNVYRTAGDGVYRFLAQTKETQLSDDKAEDGKTYSYKIKYTENGKKYKEFSSPVTVAVPEGKGSGQNRGRLYEKGAESTASNTVSVMNFAKGLMPYDVISFDIFDTLLFRPFANPSDLFVLVGERLDIMDFCEIRIQAEERAREKSGLLRGNREVTLEDIYELVAEETGVDAVEAAALEFAMECELCYGNPYMQEVFRILKGQGKTLLAVSDMYLPGEKVEILLKRCGYEGFADIFVSCDYNCSKRGGGLYDLVTAKYTGKTAHIGDNRFSDIEQAAKKGLDTRHYQNVNEAGNPFRAKDMSHLAGSAYRGMVNARLHNGRRRFSPYYEVGYVYTGWYVMGFCQWIYRYVKAHGIEKILFLAREGDIYRKVFTEMYPEIPSEYVLWSRIPVVKTIVGKNRHPYLLQIVHHKANALYKSRIGTLFDRTGIGKLKEYLADYRLKEEEFLTPENEKMVRTLLIEHWDDVCRCYEADQKHIRRYLEQKIGGASKAAVVDVGWSGNNVLQVKYLAEEVYQLNCQVSCLLAAARNVNDTYMAGMIQKGGVETYIFSTMYNKGLHDAHQKENNRLNSFFFEILTQSSTPTFLGFDREGRILYDIPEVENYGRNAEIHRGVLDFVKEYKKRFENYPYMLDISGHDAYMPFQYFSRNLLWLRKYFGSYIFGRDLFATQEKAVMESVEEVMKKAKLWEECI